MRYFDETLLATHREHRVWFAQMNAAREGFLQHERTLSALELPALVAESARNAGAAVLPRDAWQELDGITRRVMRNDEGQAYMADLMPLARPINIGKLVMLNRVSSDAGAVVRSLSGQRPTLMDKVVYEYRGTPVPIFSTGYGRAWREWNTLQSENFDALSDDQEAHVAKLRRDQALYVLNGDTGINVQGYVGYGIKTSPYSKNINIGPAGFNIDLTSTATTATAIMNFFTQSLGTAFVDANLISAGYNLYVSPQIFRNLQRPISDGAGLVLGTIYEQMLKSGEISSIKKTFELTGNQFFGFVPNSEYIRPLIGMATNTVAIARTNPFDDYNFHVWGALGLDIRADINGKSGVFYSTST